MRPRPPKPLSPLPTKLLYAAILSQHSGGHIGNGVTAHFDPLPSFFLSFSAVGESPQLPLTSAANTFVFPQSRKLRVNLDDTSDAFAVRCANQVFKASAPVFLPKGFLISERNEKSDSERPLV